MMHTPTPTVHRVAVLASVLLGLLLVACGATAVTPEELTATMNGLWSHEQGDAVLEQFVSISTPARSRGACSAATAHPR